MASAPTDSIQYGDWIIVYNSRTDLSSVIVTRGKDIQSRYGHFRHDDMVGHPWGTKFSSSNGRGFVYLLKPTPELWTQALPHRTQILYLPDIAFITSYLDIKPGSRVIEAGTGSGSFSHSLARTVGKEGRVHSFEYHEERFGKARDEFKAHKLDDVIKIKHQNVYKDGFELEDEVDSVFLDLPAPWEALEHAKKALRKDRQSRICCFSPCIEQVIRTCSALAELGFSDITMYETLTRTHDPAPLVAPTVDDAVERIQAVERKKERRRVGQIEEARKKRDEKKRKRDEEIAAAAAAGDGEGEQKAAGDGNGGEDALPAKKAKLDSAAPSEDAPMTAAAPLSEPDTAAPLPLEPPAPSTASVAASLADATSTSAASSPAPSTSRETAASQQQQKQQQGRQTREERDRDRELTVKVGPYQRGHTSYLTFAVLLPVAGRLKEKVVAVEEGAAPAVEEAVAEAGAASKSADAVKEGTEVVA
ncbi:tRNA 1-methyladenosine methyltransferase subunit GCD14 [Rhodotorula paludigena]|uniref:tRNA 1-methyladenosine methyltransferase subunit GCD14 n=1 Tax=Rhodotorula paludigena TaxID=86838 RepID=UPI0031707887